MQGGVPGVVAVGGYLEGYTGHPPTMDLRPDLRISLRTSLRTSVRGSQTGPETRIWESHILYILVLRAFYWHQIIRVWPVQGLDSRAYLFPEIAQISQLSPTARSVITLGHIANVPLM